MSGNLVQINLLGTRFTIQTDQNPQYIQSLLDRLSIRFDEIQQSLGIDDPVKVALLGALFLQDDLIKINDENIDKKTQEEVEKLRLHMIKSIEETIGN